MFIQTYRYYVLGFIIVVSAILRFWQLGIVPASLDWDEASLGYNAYAILKTGSDEYGAKFPVVLRSFGDYKPALYAYISIPSLVVFGLNEFAVRLPSAVIGIMTVFATYFLVLELFRFSYNHEDFLAVPIALLSALFLAVSPWHIQFSRVAFEANIGLGLTVFSVVCFLKGLRHYPFLPLSIGLMAINLYSYQSEKVLTPLLLIFLIFIFYQEIKKLRKNIVILSIIIGIMLSAPLVAFSALNHNAFSRAAGVSIFTNKSKIPATVFSEVANDQKQHDLLGMLIDGNKTYYLKTIIANYLSYFNFNWIFITGDINNNRHHAPFMGLLYLFDLPFFLAGAYVLCFSLGRIVIPKKMEFLLLGWLLMTPLPASITIDNPHALRAIHFLPVLQIIIALGFLASIEFIFSRRRTIVKIGFLSSLIIVFFINFAYFLDQYFVELNYFYASDWQYGYKKLVAYLQPISQKYSKIIVSNQVPFDQSYIFFLFYSRYNPQMYLSQNPYKSGMIAYDNFEFRPFLYTDEHIHNALYIGNDSLFPTTGHVIKTIMYPDGTIAMRLVETK